MVHCSAVIVQDHQAISIKGHLQQDKPFTC